MKCLKKKVICACCNNEVQQNLPIEDPLKEKCLDGYQDGVEKYFRLNECPHCHYVAYNLSQAEPEVQNSVGSYAYQEILKEDNSVFRRLKLLAFIADETYDIYGQAEAYLNLYWYSNEQGWNSNNYLQRTIGIYKKICDDDYCDPQDMITLIDLIRQDGNLKEAEDLARDFIDKVSSYDDINDRQALQKYIDMAKQELEYIEIGDINSHYRR